MKRVPQWLPLCALVVGACQSPTGTGTSPVSMLGQWGYAATQTSPVPATITGTLTVTKQSGPDFQGSLDATQVDGQGNHTPVTGPVSGQVLSASAVEFSAFIPAGRQHLGTIAGDSVHGAWVEQTSGSVTGSGSFSAGLRAPS
jgi:hypothetical protein